MNEYGPNACLALDALAGRPTLGIPAALIHFMDHSVIERFAVVPQGSYVKDPHGVYIQMLRNIGVCLVDQYLADNPLAMGSRGYEHGSFSATTGIAAVLDGIVIDSPEAVAEHLERFELPRLEEKIRQFNPGETARKITLQMSQQIQLLGNNILSTGYGHILFPCLMYYQYGYVPFLESYALYPELWERHFRLQGDYAALHNRAAAELYRENGYPLFQRLDHDMADSRSTLVSISSLEKIWLPCFVNAVQPALDAGFKLIWHCDGNVSALLPVLLEAGLAGFQGFQYEDGMDYEKICSLRTKNGETLLIEAGISVTKTLPFGAPGDVVREMKFLVEHGPRQGLFLGTSSSCLPGTPWENIKTFVEGLRYYRTNGRAGLE
jgi:hypothetical protein